MQALALKYRPKNYSELIGQDTVSRSLSHALDSKRLSHAYLFSGLRGSGKTSSARIFAKALVCEAGPISTPCEKCANCVMANEGRHLDIIEMDAASHRKIDDVRDLIEQTRYAPALARYKVFIIDEVHMLTREAFNAILKTLEEPPEYVKFILATTDPLKLPTTILSRTQHFRFKPIAKNQIVRHLERILKNENINYEIGALEILARSGSGSLRDTLTLLDQAIIYSNEQISQSVVADMLGLLDPIKIDEIFAVAIRQDRDGAIDIIKELENYDPQTIIDEMIANLKDRFLRRDAKFSLLMYERFFRILSEAKNMLQISPDNAFSLAMMLFMMMEAVNLKSIDELIEASKSINEPKNEEQDDLDANENTILNKGYGGTNLNGAVAHADLGSEAGYSGGHIKNTSVKSASYANQGNFVKDNTKNNPDQNATKVGSNLQDDEAYQGFLSKIYDRDFDLGECFKRSVEFIGFKDNTLSLASRATGNDKQILREASRAILDVLRKSFNAQTKIKIEQIEQIEVEKSEQLPLQTPASPSVTNKISSDKIDERAENGDKNSDFISNLVQDDLEKSLKDSTEKLAKFEKNSNGGKKSQKDESLRALNELEMLSNGGKKDEKEGLILELDRLFGKGKPVV